MSSVSLSALVQDLRAAGEVTRARVLALLADGELSVGELTQILGQSQPRLSRHMKFLTAAGLVERMPEGAWVFYRLPADGRSRALIDYLNASLDPGDPVIRRDRERLSVVKADRFASAEQYFARVAPQWDEVRALHYSDSEIEKAVLETVGEGPFDLMIDFGTGTGRMLALLAPRARRVEGIDLSHHMLTVARANLDRAQIANAGVRHGDATAAPFPDCSANVVVIHQVLHFLDDPARAIAEAARVLKPGGRLVVVDFAPHELEHLRREHAHRRLGVSDEDLARWCAQSGLNPSVQRRFAPPQDIAEGVAVTVTLALAPTAPLPAANRPSPAEDPA